MNRRKHSLGQPLRAVFPEAEKHRTQRKRERGI